jgi:GNAT superfamily N-acetyltransferase
MDEVAELTRLAGRSVVAMIAEALSPAFHARLGRDWAMALSGEPVADLNMILIGNERAAEQALGEALEAVRERDLPVAAMLAPHVANALAPVAEAAGLQFGGAVPLMVMRADGPIAPGKSCVIERALDPRTVAVAGDLTAAAFDLPRESVRRALDAAVTETSPAQVFVGAWDGVPMSAVTVTRSGSTVGVWNMSTPPQHQGKGMGRALLTGVMEAQRQAGVTRFYLGATAAGRPLYESLGYETIADWSAWVQGHSTQVAH